MRKIAEPAYLLEARRCLARAKRRVSRQDKRVARKKRAGGKFGSADAILTSLMRREHRCQQFLDMVLGWWRKHRRHKFPRALRARFLGPKRMRETNDQRHARWDCDVRKFLDKQYASAPHYKSCLIAVWEKYLALNLASEHFVTEFTSGKKETVFQRAWEMMVARHLDALGFAITTTPHGPDFRFVHEGRTWWVEAVSPEPMGVPADFLDGPKPGEFKVRDVPHEEIRRRWIGAIKDKAEKLASYRRKRIVRDGDAYVIAVNGCQLGALPIQHGISQFPLAVEAVYPAGPFAVQIDKNTGKVLQAGISKQWTIKSANGEPVPTSMFVNKKFADITGVIACTSDRSDEAVLPLDVVHNHFAEVSIPRGLFGQNCTEWGTEPDGGDGINLKKLEALATPAEMPPPNR